MNPKWVLFVGFFLCAAYKVHDRLVGVKPIEAQQTQSRFLLVFEILIHMLLFLLCGKVSSIFRKLIFHYHISINLNLDIPLVHITSTTKLL